MNNKSSERCRAGRRARGALATGFGLVMATAGTAAMAAPALADGDQPGGANGSVKIDGVPLDGDPSNEPHVECTFGLQFFGFDDGVNTVDVAFIGWPPTGDKTELTPIEGRSEFTFEGGRPPGNTLNHTELYELDFAGQEPGPQDAFHVKVRTTVTDAGGKVDFSKSKVFWVDRCAMTPSPSPEPTEAPSPEPTTAPSPEPSTEPTTEPTTQPSVPEPTPQPGPTKFEGGGVPGPDSGSPSGGSSGPIGWLLLAGAGLAGALVGVRRLIPRTNA